MKFFAKKAKNNFVHKKFYKFDRRSEYNFDC